MWIIIKEVDLDQGEWALVISGIKSLIQKMQDKQEYFTNVSCDYETRVHEIDM